MIEIESNWWVLGPISLLMAALHVAFPAIDRRIQRQEAVFIGLIGGVAAGYVVLYLLPKIAGMSSAASHRTTPEQLQMYYVLLAAIVLYLSAAHFSRAASPISTLASAFDYLVHGTYSVLIGYVFVELSSSSVVTNVLIAVILGCHLLGMNHLLRVGHSSTFDHLARWTFAVLLVAGTAIGLTTEVPRALLNSVTAFLGGIILVNVIAEELPLRQQRRLPWFIAGVGFYIGTSYLIFRLRSVA